MEESVTEEPKNYRHRKKLLYKTIQEQMEFYFSDASLSKDRFLSDLIANDPYVEIEQFLKFNRIRRLTTSMKDIVKALKNSTMLKVSEDNLKVCRIFPYRKKENEEECTIYVERLPDDTEHDWLKKTFSKFGPVDYVSLPRYKHNKRIKGFSFIEFANPESAQKALEYFESVGCRLPSQMAPDGLLSITTFKKEQSEQIEIETANLKESKEEETNLKRALEEDENKNEEEKSKKLKTLETENEEETATENEKQTENEDINADDEAKKKRKRKKKKKKQDELKQLGLQVLSKCEWRQLRNKYLNAQRIKMTLLKDHLKRSHAYRTTTDESQKKSEPRLQFEAGCIVHLHLSEICKDIRKLKSDIKVSQGVGFVDVTAGSNTGYVRFISPAHATQFCESSGLDASMYVLEGEEEKEYWFEISRNREKKLQKDNSKKQRGKEKLLRKAERELGKHIRFD